MYNLEVTFSFIGFFKAFDSIYKMKKILREYGLLKETVTAIVMLSKNTKAMVRSLNGDTDFSNIITRVLQGDALVPYL